MKWLLSVIFLVSIMNFIDASFSYIVQNEITTEFDEMWAKEEARVNEPIVSKISVDSLYEKLHSLDTSFLLEPQYQQSMSSNLDLLETDEEGSKPILKRMTMTEFSDRYLFLFDELDNRTWHRLGFHNQMTQFFIHFCKRNAYCIDNIMLAFSLQHCLNVYNRFPQHERLSNMIEDLASKFGWYDDYRGIEQITSGYVQLEEISSVTLTYFVLALSEIPFGYSYSIC